MLVYIILKDNKIICGFTKYYDAIHYKNKDKKCEIITIEVDKAENCKSYQDNIDFLNNAKDSMGFHII